MAPELLRIGWSARAGEDPQVPRLRERLIVQLARFDDARVIAEARRRYAEAADGTTLPAGLRSASIIVVGMDADAARFEQLRTRFLEARSDEDRWLYARALTAVRDPALAEQALQLALDARVPSNIATRAAGHDGDAVAAWRARLRPSRDATGPRSPSGPARCSTRMPRLLANAAGTATTARWSTRLLRDDAASGTASRAPAARAADQIRLLADVRDREAARLGATPPPVQAAR